MSFSSADMMTLCRPVPDELELMVEEVPSDELLARRGIEKWTLVTREPSKFVQKYDLAEGCYVLEGEAKVTPKGTFFGGAVTLKAGNFAVFPCVNLTHASVTGRVETEKRHAGVDDACDVSSHMLSVVVNVRGHMLFLHSHSMCLCL
jgi:hypothetical protein